VLLAVILAVGAPQDALFGIVLVANALIGIALLVAAAGAAALTAFWLTFRKRGQSQARPGEE
jgi:hypothetical protein